MTPELRADVIVRAYETETHGTFLAIVNTAMSPKDDVVITLPAGLAATNRVTMESMTVLQDTLTVNLKVSGVLAVQLLPDEGDDGKGDEAQTCGCAAAATPAAGLLGLWLMLPVLVTRRNG